MTRNITITAALLTMCVTSLWAEEPKSGRNLGSVQGGDFKAAAHSVIEKKCTRCHSGTLIDSALSARKDLFKIQQEMETKGAGLNSNEREVLGIYWKQQNPLKQ